MPKKIHRKKVRRDMVVVEELDLATDAFGVISKFEGDRNKVRVALDVTMMSKEVRAMFDAKATDKTIEVVVKARGALKLQTNAVSGKGRKCLRFEGGMFCIVRDGHLHCTLTPRQARELVPTSAFFAEEASDDAGFVWDYDHEESLTAGAGKAAVAFDPSDSEDDGDAADDDAAVDVDAI